MSNIVFILGAGASKQSGAPLMANFLDVASDLLRSHAVQDKRAEFEEVFNAIGALQAVHSKAQLDLTNIESIFTVFELGRIIQRIPSLSAEQIPKVIASLKELIVKTLEVTMIYPTRKQYILPPKTYGAFAEMIKHISTSAFPKRSSCVITFNYDLGADMGMYRAGLGPDYVLDQPPGAHVMTPLLKLHGSLNWATEKNSTRTIRPIHLESYFRNYHYNGFEESGETRLAIGSQLVEYFSRFGNIKVEREPVIVPPSWNKADYHNALSKVWASAAQHLSEAEQIFVLGYSLPETDSFFRHLYALGSVGNTPLRRFAVFNPDTGATNSRFEALLGPGAAARYEYHRLTFEQAVGHIKSLFPAQQ